MIPGNDQYRFYDSLNHFQVLYCLLTHWGRNKMATISQTTLSNPLSWMKICEFRFRFLELKFVTKGPINNTPALVQIMAWRRPGDKPLSEPMMVRLPTHICVNRPQWVNSPSFLFMDGHNTNFMDYTVVIQCHTFESDRGLHIWITDCQMWPNDTVWKVGLSHGCY